MNGQIYVVIVSAENQVTSWPTNCLCVMLQLLITSFLFLRIVNLLVVTVLARPITEVPTFGPKLLSFFELCWKITIFEDTQQYALIK